MFVIGDEVETIEILGDGPPPSGPPIGSVAIVDVAYAHELHVKFVDWRYDSSHNGGWWLLPRNVQHAAIKKFHLVTIVNGCELPLPSYGTFATGKEAGSRAKELMEQLGQKVQPRRITDEANSNAWRERELKRLEDGTYTHMPTGWDLDPIPDHFLHLAQGGDVPMVAFTESPEKGAIDRQTRMTPGRYLERYYPDLPDLERKRYIALVDNDGDLLFATSGDAIHKVYRNGPRSCMAHADDDYASYIHPVYVYGDSDLQLAYLRRSGAISARALVWPDKMVHGRIYGDEARMQRVLADAGYKEGDFIGAKLQRIWDDDNDTLVLPYIDWNDYVEDKNDHVVISKDGGEFRGCRQNGLAVQLTKCPKTGLYFDLEEEGIGVHLDADDPSNYEWWHRETVNRNMAVYVRNKGRWYAQELTFPTSDGHNALLQEQHKYFQSEFGGEWHRIENLRLTGNGKKISGDEYLYNTILCHGSGQRLLARDMRYLAPHWYAETYVAEHPELEALAAA